MINCLALGLRILSARVELLVLPVALSIVVLLLPPVDGSVYVDDLTAQLQALSPSGTDATDLFERILPNTVDLTLLPMGSLLTVMARFFFRLPAFTVEVAAAGLGQVEPWRMASAGEMLGLAAVFLLAGGVAGAFYFFWLSQCVPGFEPADAPPALPAEGTPEPAVPLSGLGRCVGQGILYLLLLTGIWIGGTFAAALIMSLLFVAAGLTGAGAAAGALSFLMTLLFVAVTLFLFYQTYVTAGIMLDGLNVWTALRRSFRLVRENVFSTLIFLALGGFILLGVEFLLGQLVSAFDHHWGGVLIASVIFAYIGTVVSLAFLVFYRTRYLKHRGYDIAEYFALQDG